LGDSYVWGAAAAGSWDLASNWIDTTTGQDPAPAAPGANDDVTIDAAAGGSTHVITGTGDSASLSIDGPTLLSGQFTTGTLDFDGGTNPTSNADLALNADDTLTVAGNAAVDDADYGGFDIAGGTATIDGNLTFDAYSSGNEVSDGGVLSVGGTVTSSFPGVSISGTTGARIQLAGVSGAIDLSVDSASSLEIGTAGDAASGAITVDLGASVTIGGPSEEPSCLTAPSIVDDGAIAVTAGECLNLDGGLTGSGQVDIGAGADLTVESVEAASQNTIDLTGAGGVLTIPGSALNDSEAFLPRIAGFNASDAIDFAGTATSASYASGALTLYDGTMAVAELSLTGDYAGETFNTLALASGTQINVLGQGDTATPPAGTSASDQYLWGSGIAGSWDLASDWSNATTGQNPAPVAPGANDGVTIDAAAGGSTHVITGTGDSVSLSIDGPTLLSGQFTTGTLDFDGGADPTSNANLVLNGGDTLTVAGNATIDNADYGGFDIVGGAMAIHGNLAFNAYSSVNEVSDGGALSVAGSVTSSLPDVSISGTTGAHIQLASVSGAINLSVDGASSLEIGTAGGAALGAITIDSGASATMGGPSEEPSCLTAPSIVDNGAIVAAGQSLTLDGGLTGSGQVDIGDGANLTVESVEAASQNTIDFTGAGGVLTIPGSALSASGAFLPMIAGFNASDAIDFAGTATSASYASGVLTLYNGSTAVAELSLSGNYAGEGFSALPVSLEPDSASGAQINVLGQGDTATPPAGTSTADQYVFGSGIAGSWDLASNWFDATTDQDPASVAPGANNGVTIYAAAGGSTHVITGTGDSASLSIDGPTLLSGQFTTGTLDFDGSTNPTSNANLALNAGDTLTVAGNATVDESDYDGFDIGGGAVTIDGNLAFDAYSSVNEVTGDGVLSVAGSVTSSSPDVFISGTTGARIQLASVSGAISLSVDNASSLEIGAAGGAALGAITVDSMVCVTMGGPSEEPSCLTAPSIVDDGAVSVTAGESLNLDGDLTGSGQVDIGAGADLSVEGVDAASQNTIDFTAAGGILTILGSALSASEAFLPAICGLNASDAIDFAGTATSASYADGALTLYDGTAAVATFELCGDYAGESFNASPISIENGDVSGAQISLDPNSGNVPPTVQAPMQETASSGEPLAISGVSVGDSTSGASPSVTLSDSGGLLTVTTNAPGGGGAISGSGGKNVTITGTLAQINADLSTLSYMNSTLGSDSILVSANDGLGGVTDAEISVTVSSVSASAAVDAYTANPTWGPFAVVDSAADIATNLDGLETLATAGKLVSIAVTGLPVTASVSASSADCGALDMIAGGFDVSDMAANVSANIEALNADAYVTSILLVDFTTPALTLDVAEALDDTTALGEIACPYTIAIADTTANISANLGAIDTLIEEGRVSSLARTNVTDQPYSSYAELYDNGVDAGTDYFFTNVTGEPYSAYEYDYSAGNARIGSKFDYTDITGQAYTGEAVDYNGAGLLARAAFTGVTGAAYSAYQYDYVGGVFAGSQFTFTTVPTGATYWYYETDYDQASHFTGDSFFFANIQGQCYTGEEASFDAAGAVSSVLLTGIVDQAYSSLELDYSAGTYEGYQAYYTVTGQSFTTEEVGVSAANQLEKVVYSGMTSTPYSSVEEDYSGGALSDVIYDFTNVTGASYASYQVEENASDVALQETVDLNSGGHDLIALASGQTLTSLGDDRMTGNGGTTFVLDAVYGADTIANLTGSDIVSMPDSEFASFTALSAAASFGTGAAVITAGDGDTLTLKGVTSSAQLQGLSADFTFHD
jgi:hypothetical protein